MYEHIVLYIICQLSSVSFGYVYRTYLDPNLKYYVFLNIHNNFLCIKTCMYSNPTKSYLSLRILHMWNFSKIIYGFFNIIYL